MLGYRVLQLGELGLVVELATAVHEVIGEHAERLLEEDLVKLRVVLELVHAKVLEEDVVVLLGSLTKRRIARLRRAKRAPTRLIRALQYLEESTPRSDTKYRSTLLRSQARDSLLSLGLP